MTKERKTTGCSDALLSEKAFSAFWQYQCINDEAMVTEDGKSLKVLYPGRPNDIQGADFRDAVVRSGRNLLKGDVELHLKSVDWRLHHHHHDARYNRVILHVVMNSEKQTVTTLQNGENIPVLNLGNRLCFRLGQEDVPLQPILCSGIGTGSNSDKVFEIIEKAGESRFLEKASVFRKEIRKLGRDEALYRSLMKAMGYSGNTEPFLKLAAALSLKELGISGNDSLTDDEYRSGIRVQLLGGAGFLNDRFTDNLASSGLNPSESGELRKRWHASGRPVLVSPDEWQLFRIRPGNSPVRRLLAVCNILSTFRKKGLSESILAAAAGISEEKGRLLLEKAIIQAAVSKTHPDPVLKNTASLLGKNRAAVITVNVLLPFLFAVDRGESALSVYHHYPKLPEHSLERHMMEQLGLKKADVKTAVGQQGLIAIYKHFCIQGKCPVCELGKLEAGGYIQ